MDRDELRSWFEGPVFHTHLRSEDEPLVFESSDRHQFTQEAALHYLRELTGNPDARIVDTNHALLGLDVDNLKRPESIPMWAWRKQVVDRASERVLERAAKIRMVFGSSRIIVGVEVDIIDDKGGLSLNDNCISQLDVVIASFHKFVWKAFSGEKDYSKQFLIEAYKNAVDNPNVVVLGHPTRCSSKVISLITPDDFGPVFEVMNKNGVAFEINLLEDLSSPEEALTVGVMKKAIEMMVPLIVGCDFHHFEDVGLAKGLGVYGGVVNEENVQEIFKQNRNFHYRLLRRLTKNIRILNTLGVTKDNIVNSSDQAFSTWLRERRRPSG